ncbi:MAG TPA: GAF domain-containing protein [Bryobacteraceae bacterium]|nr:GAF domain-containing protein [Bryobacteraceae bacterium]
MASGHILLNAAGPPCFVALHSGARTLQPVQVLAALLAIASAVGMWWLRERRIKTQNDITRALNKLAEGILEAASPAEIVRLLNAVLPSIRGITTARLFIHDPAASALRPVSPPGPSGPVPPSSVSTEGAALCFRNRTLIAISDTRRSSFLRAELSDDSPRSVMFTPMFARGEPAGVLVLEDARGARDFSATDQASAQHLANQIAAAIRLQDQQAVRERLFRSEKQAAAGQLMAGIADELRTPLETVRQIAEGMRRRRAFDADDVDELILESHRACDIVRRLVALTDNDMAEPQPVDLSAVVSGILAYRTADCRARGVELRYQLSSRPLTVSGSRGHLEQAIVSLLAYAERCVIEARTRAVMVSTSLLASRVLVEIAWQCKPEMAAGDPFQPDRDNRGSLSLSVCRGIIQNHGGDVRLMRASASQARFDIELPALEAAPVQVPGVLPQPSRGRQLTALVVGPEAPEYRELIRMLSELGDRAVPINSAEEAIDLAQRMRFDVVITAMRLPGLGWTELYDRVHAHVGEFILVTNGRKPDIARALRGAVQVLAGPVQKPELERLLAAIEQRASSDIRAQA